MFRPQAMTEVELIVPAKDLLAVTNMLADQGILHQVDASFLSAEANTNNVWPEKAAHYAAFERRIQNILQVLGLEEDEPAITEDTSLIETDVVEALISQIEQQVTTLSDELAEEHKQLKQLENTIHQLEPIANLDLDLSALHNTRYTMSMLGIILTDNLARLKTSLSRTPFVLLPLRQDGNKQVVWLTGARRDADILQRAARSAYLNPLNIPEDLNGSASKIVASLQAEKAEVQRRINALQTAKGDLRDSYAEQLHILLWRVRAGQMLARAISQYGKLRHTYVIVGWVPSLLLDELITQLKQTSRQIMIESTPYKRSGSEPNVPVSLNNPGIAGAFQPLVTTYAQPSYKEIDPTLLMTLTFPFLFGVMFGDVGHGLLLFLLGMLLSSRRVNALQGMAGLGPIVTVCGLAATAFGFVFGSLFGDEEILTPLWVSPMHDIMQILAFAVVAGIVLLSIGFIVGVINAWFARDWGEFLFGHHGLTGLAFYWSFVGIAASSMIAGFPIGMTPFAVLAGILAIVVMFSDIFKKLVSGQRPLIEDGIGTYLVQVFFELFETALSLFSNSLSYVRVGAFAVAHGGLSSVIFVLAEMASASQGPGYWIVVVIGNLFIVGFEGLIVGIQTMRLEYYEFFSKFFHGSGVSYAPLTLQPSVEK